MEDEFFPFQKDDFQVKHVKLWEGNFSNKDAEQPGFPKNRNPKFAGNFEKINPHMRTILCSFHLAPAEPEFF